MAEPVKAPTDVEKGVVYLRNPKEPGAPTYEVKAEKAEEYIKTRGWVPAEKKETESLRAQQFLAESMGTGEALGVGAVRGLTGRLIDPLIASTPEGQKYMQALERREGAAGVLGEVAGTVAPFLLTGGTSAARLLTLPGLAEAAGRGVTTGLLEGAPGIGTRLLAPAAGFAVESVPYALAHSWSQNAVEDVPLDAEHITANLGLGLGLSAIMGLPVGGLQALRAARASGTAKHMNALQEAIMSERAHMDPMELLKLEGITSAPAAQRAGGVAEKIGAKEMLRGATPEEATRIATSGKFAENPIHVEIGADGKFRVVENADLLWEARNAGATKINAKVWNTKADGTPNEVFEGLFDISTPHIPLNDARRLIEEYPRRYMYDPAKKPGMLDKLGAWAEGETARDISHVRQNTQLMDRVVRDAEFAIKAKSMSDAATDVAMLGQIATELHKGGAKFDQWKQWVTTDYGTAKSYADELISGVRQRFKEAAQTGKLGTLVKGEEKIKKWLGTAVHDVDGNVIRGKRGALEDWENRIASIRPDDPNAATRIFVELDQMKRALGANSKPDKWLGQDAAAFFREEYNVLAGALENEARWGAQAAGYQKQLNRVYHDWLNGEGTFNKHFMGQGIDTAAFSDWNKNPLGLQKSAADYLNLMGKAGSEQEQALVITQLQRDRKFAQFMLDKYELPAEQRSALQRALSGTYRMEKAIAEGKDFMRIYRAAEALTGGRRRWIEFPILGAMAGGLPGALAGQVAMFAMNPGEQMRFWALARRLKEGTLSGMVRATERFGGTAVPRLKGVGGVDDTLSASSRAGRAGKATLFEQLSDKGESEEDSYRRITNAYRDAAMEPGKIEGNLQQTMPEWARMQPDLIKEMAGVEQRKAQAIAAALPPGQDMIDKMLGIEPMPVSYGQIDDAARLIEAANDPLSALEKMGDGRLTPAEVDVIEQVYPRMIQEMRLTVIEAAQHGELEWSQKVQMGILLKVPTDISLKPEFIAAMQAAAQSQGGEEQPGMGGKKPGINPVGVTREYGKMLRPTSEQLEARASEER